MKYTKNLNLNLPEGEDPLVVKDLSDNFETLDEVVAETQKMADPYKVGDIVTTWRTDLGDDWLLCNGEVLERKDYPVLYDITPGAETFLVNGLNYSVDCAVTGNQSRYAFCAAYDRYFIDIYFNASNTEIKVTDVITGEAVTVPTNTGNAVNSAYVNGTATITDDGVFHYFVYNSSSQKACIIRCNGNPMTAENWEVFLQQSTSAVFSNNNVAAILPKGNDTYHAFCGQKHAEYKIVPGVLTLITSGNLPSKPRSTVVPNLTRGVCKVFNGGLYTIVMTGTAVQTIRLKDDMTGWDIIGETTTANSYSYIDAAFFVGDKNNIHAFYQVYNADYTGTVGGAALYCGPATYITVGRNGNFSALEISSGTNSQQRHINPIASLIFEQIVRIYPQVYKGKYYFEYTANRFVILPALTAEAFDTLAETDIVTANDVSISNQEGTYIFEGSDNAMVLGASKNNTVNLPAYIVPNFALPKMGASATYTYIKAKEATADANQQTDAPSA